MSMCTQICGQSYGSNSCADIVLVNVYTRAQPRNRVKLYAIVADQSNSI